MTPSGTIHFDLSAHTGHFRDCWVERIRQWATHAPAAIAASGPEADFIIDTAGEFSLFGPRLYHLRSDSLARRFPEKTFGWDCGDFPTGRMPGFYCSLPRAQFDAVRHRGFCYPLRYNSCVGLAPQALAEYLLGFTGQLSSPLRAKVFAALAPDAAAGRALMRRTDGTQWGTILSAGVSDAKAQYADDLARCKFVLCPRGNGVSSIRLFETMEAGRVPVILSDRWVAPTRIDWTTCSLRIAERDLPHLHTLVQEHEPNWRELASAARGAWEEHFSDGAVLGSMATQCAELTQAASVHRRWSATAYFARLLPALAITKIKTTRQGLARRRRLRSAGLQPPSAPRPPAT